MKAAVVVFPGSNCDTDCYYALERAGFETEYAWHKNKNLPKVDLVVLPGGFSYGDYLRTGAIAKFSPVMESVRAHADAGRAVLGICNGFQILLEAGFLPGAMLRNKSLSFLCQHVWLKVENTSSRFTQAVNAGCLNIPIAHGEGNYYCDDETLKRLNQNRQVVFRYASKDGKISEETNPNGSRENIAGIINEKGNVLGMMPHPERSSESLLGSSDGSQIWESILG